MQSVAGDWRKLHNEQLHDLYCSPNITWVITFSRIRWSGHTACSGRTETHPGFEWGNFEGKRPHGMPRHMWEGNVKMDREQIEWEGID
jgi:hypothetical protein